MSTYSYSGSVPIKAQFYDSRSGAKVAAFTDDEVGDDLDVYLTVKNAAGDIMRGRYEDANFDLDAVQMKRGPLAMDAVYTVPEWFEWTNEEATIETFTWTAWRIDPETDIRQDANGAFTILRPRNQTEAE